MDLIGKKVRHSKFGEGTITSQESTYVSVKFESEAEPKKFVYPACFKTFLKLMDAETAALAEETVKQQEEQDRRKKQQEMEVEEARRFAKECRTIAQNPENCGGAPLLVRSYFLR